MIFPSSAGGAEKPIKGGSEGIYQGPPTPVWGSDHRDFPSENSPWLGYGEQFKNFVLYVIASQELIAVIVRLCLRDQRRGSSNHNSP